jgi:hypothetical protein
MGVVLHRIALRDDPQLLLGTAELRGVVVGAGQQQPGAGLLRGLFHDTGQQPGRARVVLGVEQQTGAFPALRGGLLARQADAVVE